MTDDFYGLSQQVRWIGFVEDNRDPSQLGRCKVRILVWHSDDKNLAPTDCLPWAQAQHSPGTRSFSVPKVGEWVTGYFLDGKMAQYPVFDGILPGVNYNLSDPIPGAPRPIGGIILEQDDTPSISRIARGELKNSLIDRANQNRGHVCDETLGIRIRTRIARLKNSEIVQSIRRAIKKLIGLLNTTDQSGVITFAINQLKKITSAINYIRDVIVEILEFVELIKIVVRTIRAIIDYILGLPAKAFKFLQQCISVVLGAIVSGVSDLFSGLTPETLPGSDISFDELFKEGKELLEASSDLIGNTVELVAAPITIIAAFAEPSTVEQQEAAISGLLSSQVSQDEVVEQNSFNAGLAPHGA